MDASERCRVGAGSPALLVRRLLRRRSLPGEQPPSRVGAATVDNGTVFNGTVFNGTSSTAQAPAAPVCARRLRLDGASAQRRVPRRRRPRRDARRRRRRERERPRRRRARGHRSPTAPPSRSGSTASRPAATRTCSATASLRAWTARRASSRSAASRPTATPVQAIPLAGSWDASEGTPTGGAHVDDPNVFTFACEGYALAKCVELRLRAVAHRDRVPGAGRLPRPARSRPSTRRARACLRADYCGDGTATTRDGTLVDVWDASASRPTTRPPGPSRPSGAPTAPACVDATRWPTLATTTGRTCRRTSSNDCPDRWQPAGCGGRRVSLLPRQRLRRPSDARALLRTRITRRNDAERAEARPHPDERSDID